MSSTAEMIEVVCPRCGDEYGHWYQPEDPAAMASCPHCGHDLAGDRFLHENGVWALTAEDEATDR
jgi:DNA-directed RNA polymerase subunit RPC12/RpoP